MASGDCAAIARELYAVGEEGPIFGPVDFTIDSTGLTVFSGPSGSGRTALALVLSGRMKSTSGTIEVLGLAKDKDVRRHVALAGVPQIDELERSVKVADIVTESKAWAAPWFSRVSKADRRDLEELCAPVYGDRDLPDLDIYVSELQPLDDALLRVCFALRPAHNTSPEILVLDDLEQLVDREDQRAMLDILARIAEDIAVVVTTVNPLGDDAPPHKAFDLNVYESEPDDEPDTEAPVRADADTSVKEDNQ